jgi:serine/threonine-protein kinase
MTQAGSLMGTADYMAPELAAGAEAAGPAADQYSLGLIAYQMLVGRHPFPADNPLSALMAHAHKPVPIPSQLGVVLAPGVESALLRALAKKPEERFARSGDFVRALAGSQFSVPTSAVAAFASPTTSPSQPPSAASSSQPPVPATPIVAAPAAPLLPTDAMASPLLSPAALVGPVARVEPPTPEPTVVTPGAGVVPGAAVAATAVIAAPKTRGGFPWRRALVPGVLVLVLALLALRGGIERGATGERTNPPQQTAQQTAARTVAATTAPTVAPTLVPTARPTVPAVADDYGNSIGSASGIAPGPHEGTIAPAGDVDFFRIIVPASTAVAVELHADTLVSGAVTVFSMSGNELTDEVNTGPDRVAKVTYFARDAGAYFVRVRGVRSELTGTYTISYSVSGR